MNIGDYITFEHIDFSSEIQSKKRALEALSRMLAEGDAELDANRILTSLTDREKLGSTGLGDGVAIPHGRIPGLNESLGAFLRLAKGVDYEANDGQPVDLVFGLLVPQDTNENHLNILAALAEMCTDDDFCARLRQTRQPGELYRLLSGYKPAPASEKGS